MLNDASGFQKIYLVTGYTDLRRGMEGLANIIRFRFHAGTGDRCQTPYRADRGPEETFLSFVHFAEIFCGQFYLSGLTVRCLSTTVLPATHTPGKAGQLWTTVLKI